MRMQERALRVYGEKSNKAARTNSAHGRRKQRNIKAVCDAKWFLVKR